MERYTVTIPLEHGQKAHLFPIGDIHRDAPGCREDLLRRHMAATQEYENPWYIGMGDYTDLFSPSNRGALKALIEAGKLYEGAEGTFDQIGQEAIDVLADDLAVMEDRTIGILQSHHRWKFADGSDTDMRLAARLNARHAGTVAQIQVRLKPKNPGKAAVPYFTVLATHGYGGGVLKSAPLNRLERWVNGFEQVDVVLMGHVHQRLISGIPRVWVRWPQLGGKPETMERTIIVACTGSFLEGYPEGTKRGDIPTGGYVESKMLSLNDLGGIGISIQSRLGRGFVSVKLAPFYVNV